MPIEALRGLLAIVVFNCHFVSGFVAASLPAHPDIEPPFWIGGTPLGVVFNGSSAVVVFYVVTGFVLTVQAFVEPRRSLLPAAVRRWPRLAIPALLSVLVSYALFSLGLYAFQAAGESANSPFLFAFFDHLGYPPARSFEPSLADAVGRGLIGVFLWGDTTYNPVLWMMRLELSGGLFALCAASVLRSSPSRVQRASVYAAYTIGALMWPAFLIGVAIARRYAQGQLRIASGYAVASGVAALFFLAPTWPMGVYAWVGAGGGLALQASRLLGAGLLVSTVLQFRGVGLSDAVSRGLGSISFPLFLVHMPVMGSVGSHAYLAAVGAGLASSAVVVVTLAATVVGCVVPVLAFLAFDRWWVAAVGRASGRLFASRRLGDDALAILPVRAR